MPRADEYRQKLTKVSMNTNKGCLYRILTFTLYLLLITVE